MESASKTSMPSEVLASAINKTLYATGNDELRPIMSGVFCELSSEGCTFVATDAHKLVKYARKDATADNTVSFILPKPLNLLKNSLVTDSEVSIEYNETNAYFVFDDIELICRLIDGKYPNYEAVIPKENPNVLTIDRLEFYNSIRRVAIFCEQIHTSNKTKSSRVRVTYISSEDLDFSNEAFERLTCQYVGEDMEIGFNSRFIGNDE